jgi:Domain of unknown function (DUF4279)
MSLRVRHPTMDPTHITQALGIEPQHGWRAGEKRSDPTGRPLGGARHDSYWMSRLIEEPRLSAGKSSVESLLEQALARFRRSQPFFDELRTGGGNAELDVTLFARENFRLDLSVDSLTALHRLGLAVTLEVRLVSPSNSVGLQA